jgi:hypothetical protein
MFRRISFFRAPAGVSSLFDAMASMKRRTASCCSGPDGPTKSPMGCACSAWAGALSDMCGRFTSVELRHALLDARTERP